MVTADDVREIALSLPRDLVVGSWRMTVPKKVWGEYLASQQPPASSPD